MYQRTEITRPKGINKDLSPYELPPEVWSDGRNVSFRRHRTNKIEGYENQFPNLTSTVVGPKYHIYFNDSENAFWAYASNSDIYKSDGTDLGTTQLGTGYSATSFATWSGCNFNSLIVMNNKFDVPQILEPTSKDSMIDMPHWGDQEADSTLPPGEFIWGVESRCEVIRPYKNYLFALDCYDDSGTRYPNMVRWSSPAQLGDVPPSWDPTSPSEQAGLYTLADTPGRVVEGLTLGDYFCIYKTDCVWLVQFVGGDFVFSFRKLFGDEAGCLGKDCVAEFDGKHFVLSPTGAYIHNAHSKEEVMDPWVKDELFEGFLGSPEEFVNTKVVADHNNKEIWVYYRPDGATSATKALIWNWEIQEWTIRELTGIDHIAEGYIDNATFGVDDWDSDAEPWNADVTIWDNGEGVSPLTRNLLFADAANLRFYGGGTVTQLGEPLLSWVRRIGIDFNDDQNFKYVSRITPHISRSSGPVTVKIFAEDVQTGVPDLQEVAEFDPQNDQWVDCHVVGRYIGIQFESENAFALTGYTIEWEPTGNY